MGVSNGAGVAGMSRGSKHADTVDRSATEKTLGKASRLTSRSRDSSSTA